MSACVQLGPDDEIVDLEFHKITLGCFQQLLRDNLSGKLRSWNRSPGSLVLALTSAEKIVGVIAFENYGYRKYDRPGQARIIIELAVPSRRYKRLSKLVLRAALSREARLLVEANHKGRVSRVRTTAFSEHPESMKYRGLFSLVSRETLPAGRGYKLVYEGAMTDLSLSEHLRLWLKGEGEQAQAQAQEEPGAESGTMRVEVQQVAHAPTRGKGSVRVRPPAPLA